MFNIDSGAYHGFVKIRSTVSCKTAHKLMYDQTTGGAGFFPAGGWYWWPGFNHTGRDWRKGAKEVFRGFHIARTNERQGSRSPATMLEHDLITYDTETLIDCSKVPKVVHCVSVTPASYVGVHLASSVSCPGQFLAGPGSYKYHASKLTVTNTTCAAGKRLARKIPAYRVLRPLKVDGFYCTATMEGRMPLGGFQHYTCRKQRELVRWRLEIQSEL